MNHLQESLSKLCRKYVLLAFVVYSSVGNAQWFVYGGPGFAYFQGDVADSYIPRSQIIKFNGKLGLGYTFRPRWAVRLHGSYGNLHGSDSYSADDAKVVRGITFDTRVIDAGVTLRYMGLFNSRSRFINYGFLGFDYMNMAVNRTVNGTAALIAEDPFSPHQFNVPLGIGFGKWFHKHWGWVAELTTYMALTDYLDGTSNAGNPRALDAFTAVHVMVLYRFSGGGTGRDGVFDPSNLNNVDCPRF